MNAGELCRRLAHPAVALGLLVVVAPGCATHRTHEEFLALATRTEAGAIPSGARLLAQSQVEERSSSMGISWEVEPDLPWARYSEFLDRSVAPQFDSVREEEGRIVLRRSTRGETQSLTVEATAATPAPRARLTFLVSAD